MDTLDQDETREQARRLLRERRWEDLLRLTQSAVERYPLDAELRWHLGTALLDSDAARAMEETREAIRLAPEDPWLLTRAGGRMLFFGDVEAATDCAQRAFDTAPPDFRFAADLAHLAGQLAIERGVDGEALLRAAFEAEPTDISFATGFASMLVATDR